MPDLNEILKSALSLPSEDRAALADRLLASLDELDEEEAERLWTDEAQRRLEELRTGRVMASDSRAVAEKASRLFRE